MNFKEAFGRYKAGTATAEEAAFVEAELEKNRLISEYLADDITADPAPAGDPAGGEGKAFSEAPGEELKKVRRSIRRRSRNIIVTAVAIIAALGLAFYFAGVPVLNGLYFDPTRRSGSIYSYDIDASLAAFTELFFAGEYASGSVNRNTGIGRDDMTLIPYDLVSEESEYTSATLDRNALSVPVDYTIGNVPVTVFARASYPFYSMDGETKEKYEKELAELPEYMSVYAAVSFSEDLSMSRLVQFMNGSKVTFLWAGIRNTPEHSQLFPICGMDLTGAGPVFQNVDSAYPGFELRSYPGTEAPDASDFENHFTALARYSLDHAAFLQLLNKDTAYKAYFQSVLNYVTSNGVKTYGVMVKGTAADILALMETGVVSQIMPRSAEVSF
jgi:hypothetical protein